MAFMGKGWVTLAEWMRYERRVLKRAWEEINLVLILCSAVFGGVVTYWLEYEEGFRPARDSVRIFGTAALGALAANLLYFWLLVLTAPAKMDAESKAAAAKFDAEAKLVVAEVELGIAKLHAEIAAHRVAHAMAPRWPKNGAEL